MRLTGGVPEMSAKDMIAMIALGAGFPLILRIDLGKFVCSSSWYESTRTCTDRRWMGFPTLIFRRGSAGVESL